MLSIECAASPTSATAASAEWRAAHRVQKRRDGGGGGLAATAAATSGRRGGRSGNHRDSAACDELCFRTKD